MSGPGRYLVTGGAGFIGAPLARLLRERGDRVWVLDNLSTGKESNIPAGCEFLRLDLAAPGFTDRLPAERFDAVLHLAAQSSGEISHADPVRDFQTNLAGTVALLQWASTRTPRFLYASSMAAYGQPDVTAVDEETPLRPLSYYGLAKGTAEEYVRRFNRPDFGTTSFRLFSVYGPGQNLDNLKQGMISIYLAYALKGDPIVVKGAGDRFRDFVYIDDVAAAWTAALNAPASHGAVLNIGTGVGTRVKDVLAQLLRALGKPADHPIRWEGPTPNDQFGLTAKIDKARRLLGWSPRVALAEGLERMARWAQGTKTP